MRLDQGGGGGLCKVRDDFSFRGSMGGMTAQRLGLLIAQGPLPELRTAMSNTNSPRKAGRTCQAS